jgi:MFS-type transporter involved in bile tolerance (Atg22 family)
MGIACRLLLLLVISLAFAISEVFHNAMLPSVAPDEPGGAGLRCSPSPSAMSAG